MVNYNIGYFGDDYYYLTYTQGNITNFINNHINHYFHINGRFIVHILVTIFLWLDLFWWKILNSLMLSGIVYFGIKIFTYKKCNIFTLLSTSLIMFSGICLLDINVTRQSVFWLTGSFNYVYPIFILIVFWYTFNKYIDTKKGFGFTLLLAFLSSASVEQVALMTIGLIILTNLINLFFTKEKLEIDKNKMLLIFIVAMVGMSSVIFTPSTFIRFKLENSENISLLESIKDNLRFLVNVYLFSKIFLPYNLMLMISTVLTLIKYSKKNIIRLVVIFLSLSIPLYLVNVLIISDASLFSISKVLLSLITLISYFCIFILLPFALINKNLFINYNQLIITEILFFGSQAMILFFPVCGNRNLLFGIIMLLFFIIILVSNLDFHKNILFIFYYSFIYLILLVFSIMNIYRTTHGYYITAKIQSKNIEIINNNKEIYIKLKTLPNDNYGWSMPYYSKYHEFYFKRFYNIEKEIIWE
jgi:hypothetical protein